MTPSSVTDPLRLPAIALVLSGGGALGAAHVGYVRELLKYRSVDAYAGTSAGAIVAAALACGMDVDEISNQLRQKRLLTLAFDFSWRGSGFIRGNKVLELFRRIYDDREFSDLPEGVSLNICATDFLNGKLVVLNSGRIAEAVRASLSVPGLFEPVWKDGRPLVDGGLVCNLPIGVILKSYQGEKIVAIDVCSCLPSDHADILGQSPGQRLSLRKSIERSVRIMFRNQHVDAADNPRVILIRPNLSSYNAIDITKLSQIEEKGGEAFLASVYC